MEKNVQAILSLVYIFKFGIPDVAEIIDTEMRSQWMR